ncbi:uncharacterized protein LOC124491661 [Dermatophagoides farinae]|uniref:Uncharacterized protein n=1 Tax=Dermatophagoides farinae TaxID=6954 RepID=A0A922L8N1_DERFA|nr:uncharacterized protein LOC124491661 [Dermatophagoides farinae]KAH7641557.1 hypothetical protein HUG17_4602 [Dermatophagoides farinae]KAH9527411.1 hypothetical protein DERF_001428 [Dermatophagoides farinae]
MEIDRQIRLNENDLSTIQMGIKPSAMNMVERKKVLSLMSTNTPANNRRKLGNLSNTPFQSLKKDQSQKNSKGILQQQQCSSMKKSTNLKSTPLPKIDEIENAYPLTRHEYREHHFSSEISDYYIQRYHNEIMSAPLQDENETKRFATLQQMQDELSVEDYFADFI